MATDHSSPWESQVNMGRLANASAGDGQPQTRFTTAGGSDGTYEWTNEEEARSTGMPIDLMSHRKEPGVTESTAIHFVTESGRARPDGKSRTLIRSLARRKPENRAIASRQSAVIARKEGNANARDDSDRDHYLVRQKQRYADRGLNPFPGKAVVDPFGTIPVSNVGNSQFFIRYYDTVFTETWAPVNPKKQYLPFVMTDAALLHATLSHSAIRHDMLQGNAGQDAAYHKAKAIQIINQRLRDPELECTDATITAVACLTLFETLQGSEASANAKLHMDGLEAMVKSRGGIDAIQEGSHAKKLATWIDSCAAIALQTPPRFPLTPSFEDDNPTIWLPPSPLARSYLTTLTSHTSLPFLASEVLEVYWGLRNVSHLKEMTSRLAKPVEIDSYTDMVERLERRTVAIVQSDILAQPSYHSAIFLLFGNAAFIHIYLFMRDMPGGLPLAANLSTRILTTLSLISPSTIQTLQTLFPELTLWIFIMAGIGATATTNRKFFAGLTAESCRRLGMGDADQLAGYLGEWMWSQLYRAPVTGRFWRDVAVAVGVEEVVSGEGGGGWETRVVRGDNSMATFNVLLDVGE